MPVGGCDCYLVDRKVIEVLERLDEKNSSLTLQVLWAGFRTDMIYFVRQDREIGKSRWTLSKKVKLVMDSEMSFSYFPLRLMSGLGVVLCSSGVIMLMLGILGEYIWRTLDAARTRPPYIVDEILEECDAEKQDEK